MPYALTLPFYAFRLKLFSGNEVLIPMKDKEARLIDEPLHLLAGKYAEALQRHVFDKGKYVELLKEYQSGDFHKDTIEVNFDASKDKIRFPAFALQFDYYYIETNPEDVDSAIWVLLPALGIETFLVDKDILEWTLRESIYLEFARSGRLNALQKVVSTIWFENTELLQDTNQMQFYSMPELENLHEEKKEQLLPEVAMKLVVKEKEVYGRRVELNQLAQSLRAKFNKNVLLVGTPGVGKTALIREIVRQKKKRNIDGEFWETTASAMIKELMRETGWQDNMVYFCKELAKRGDFLFVRNLMELFEVGKYEGNSTSMAEYMSSYISRGEVNMISECTEGELAKIELRSPQFISYFQVIRVEEPKQDLEAIILSKVKDLAKKRAVKLKEDSIKETLRLNRRFTPYAGFPGKPIRFLENLMLIETSKSNRAKHVSISKTQVINQFCEETGMPRFIVDPSIPMDVEQVKGFFQEQLFGQNQAIDSVVDMLAAVKASLTRTGKPIASFLFVGPTGVGKTEMAKILAEFMFGSRERMIRFDMSEYGNAYSVMNLIGTDYNSNGRLTSAVRRAPFSVLLFDEIEKAHSNFYDLLLQLLSEGRLTDAQGKLVNFCSTIIIMTSNIGAANLQNRTISFSDTVSETDVASHFRKAVEMHFRPELYNRIDQVVPFYPLQVDVIRHVVSRELELFQQREGVRFRKMDLHLDESVYLHFSKEGSTSKYGARYLQRSLQEALFIPLAKAINIEDFDDQLIINVSSENGKIEIKVEADPIGLDLMLEELDKINLADYSSELRRNIASFQEGHFYVRLLSEINIMERQQKRKNSTFWENKDKAKSYSNLLQTQKDVTELKLEIEDLEMNLSLSCLGQLSYQTAWEQSLKNWALTFVELKIDFYARRHLAQNVCRLNIYGLNPEPLLDFYAQLFERKNYKILGYSIWYNAAYFNSQEDENTETKKKRESYKKIPWTGVPQTTREGDVLVGAEFLLMGKAVQLFLAGEIGGQEWKVSDKKINSYLVLLEKEGFTTPKGIHKASYYKNQAIRRRIEATKLDDKNYNIHKQIAKKKYLDPVLKFLEQRFRREIDEALL